MHTHTYIYIYICMQTLTENGGGPSIPAPM